MVSQKKQKEAVNIANPFTEPLPFKIEKLRKNMNTEAILKLIKNYKKEIDGTSDIRIVILSYLEEETDTYRRQIIIDYSLLKIDNNKKNDKSKTYIQ